ncbi:MAG: glycosyltransferase [Candidatus Alcyoniella australis]|nr:glycosyltransferase [Candidatus Alcyoniella australis]
MEFTGERLVPGKTPDRDLEREHLARYIFAAGLAKGRRVLDLGCGAGYGAQLLLQSGAQSVLGLDVASEAVEYARQNYSADNLRFEIGDAANPEIEPQSFDLVVCFEVIEHLLQQRELVQAAARTLVPGGLFVVSTPNVAAPSYEEHDNPFHVKELNRKQFDKLLHGAFQHVELLGQSRFAGHAVLPIKGDAQPRIERLDLKQSDLEPLYFVAVCSSRKLPKIKPLLARAPYFGNLDELLSHLKTRDAQIEQRDERIVELQDEVGRSNQWAQGLDQDLKRNERELSRAKLRIAHQSAEIERVRQTLGYRLHQKLAPWARGTLTVLKFATRLTAVALGLVLAVPLGALALVLLVPRLLLAIGLTPLALYVWLRLRLAGSAQPKPTGPIAPAQPIEPQRDGISVIVPTWNGLDLVREYLPGVAQDIAGYAFEVELILVDNGSDDGTAQWVEQHLPQVRVLRLDRNLGFGGGCNAGVEAARFGIVYMLNNDMRVEPGFLEPTWQAFEDRELFAATSRISFEQRDGAARRSEESGLTVAHWHRGLLQLRHLFDNQSDVAPALYAGGGSSGYCKAKFQALGGFDALYEPFYVEDLDLSYRAWKRGFRVLYLPQSAVVHKHRGTIGKHYSRARLFDVFSLNYLRFTWRDITGRGELLRHCLWLPWSAARTLYGRSSPGQGVSLRALIGALKDLPQICAGRTLECKAAVVSDDTVLQISSNPLAFRERCARLAKSPHRSDKSGAPILFISPYCPFPPTHGGAVRMYNVMRQVAKHHPIGLVSMIEHEHERDSRDKLLEICDEVHFMLRGQPDRISWSDPASVQEFYSDEFARLIQRVLARGDYRIVQMEYTILAHFMPQDPRVKTVLTEIDLYFVSYLRAARAQRALGKRLLGFYEWLRMFRYELRWCRRYDLLLAMSEHDRDVLAQYVKETPIEVAPNGVDVEDFKLLPREPDGPELLFVGNFRHAPNLDAALWMAREIFPEVRKRVPDARLAICGPNPPESIARCSADEGIEVAGFVPDLAPRYQRAACFVAPITRGSGTRLKILEAQSSGLPVVSTTLGAEGLAIEHGENLLIADNTADFAQACVRLLTDEALALRLRRNGRELVERVYAWERVGDKLEAAYARLLEEDR